jgi:uncharacterized SAM-binding protein YcdF (DUF218 family)
MRRFLLAAGAWMLAAAAVAIASVAVRIGVEAHRDDARPADAIVVLGAAEYMGRPSPVLKARLDHALELYRRGMAPLILTTGGRGAGSPFTEAEAARDYLVAQGVEGERVLLEPDGTTTLQSAAGAVAVLKQHNLGSCIVVSDGYHVFRVKRILEDHGIRVHGSPRPSERADSLQDAKLYVKQSAAFWLWRLGFGR